MTCPISLETIPVGDDGQPLNRAYAIVTPNGSQVYRRSNLTEHLRHHGNWWPHAGAGAMIVPDNVRASLGLPPRGVGGAVGANTNIASLIHAVRYNDIESVRTLIQSGVNVDGWSPPNAYRRPLHLAITMGRLDMVELLIANGANVNAIDNHGETPLHMAAYYATAFNRDIVEFLLENDANVNAVNNNGETPLHNAAYRGHYDIGALLVDRGANVNAIDNNGETPLHNAASRGHLGIAALLLGSGANVSIRNQRGRTARNRATRNTIRSLLFNRPR